MIEGVSYSQRDCLDIIEELGVAVSDVRASGGGAKSAFWRGLLAGILNKRVVTLETQEGSAYGAALLALAGRVRQRAGDVQGRDQRDGGGDAGCRRGGVLCKGAPRVPIDVSGAEADLRGDCGVVAVRSWGRHPAQCHLVF